MLNKFKLNKPYTLCLAKSMGTSNSTEDYDDFIETWCMNVYYKGVEGEHHIFETDDTQVAVYLEMRLAVIVSIEWKPIATLLDYEIVTHTEQACVTNIVAGHQF